ncbi:class I SAM-dependent methyltransferase [Pseudonocardia humida]|uniref:Methyltransferase domain-containing protein n=1 Tax=Pseudonocardia humida TaxID=2800819 RepID=A0ABT1A4S2_9PSEU|nr:methyltransferase domain-containing protein [Pseudonocardia humida]MCO1658007.1 methyltransferase domain-containing protein [Pseudonocardia humida]
MAQDGPRGWAAPLHALALDRAGVGPGTRLLDLGCGSGEFAAAAAERGAVVTGIDADPAAVAAAAARVPGGEFRVGDAHEPPPGPFDVVAAVQLLMHAADPVSILRRSAAVAPIVVITLWGRESECDLRAFGEALAQWLPPRPPPRRDPLPITEPGRISRLVDLAGLHPITTEDVDVPFHYPDADALVGPVLAAGIGTVAARVAGPAAVREALLRRCAEYRTPDGGYRLVNRFHLLTARPRP